MGTDSFRKIAGGLCGVAVIGGSYIILETDSHLPAPLLFGGIFLVVFLEACLVGRPVGPHGIIFNRALAENPLLGQGQGVGGVPHKNAVHSRLFGIANLVSKDKWINLID